jgi:hypothetical protein
MTPLNETVLKLLIRCALSYESITYLTKLFKMANRHAQMSEVLEVLVAGQASEQGKRMTTN